VSPDSRIKVLSDVDCEMADGADIFGQLVVAVDRSGHHIQIPLKILLRHPSCFCYIVK
jgi:hypothetical protein